MRGVSKWIDFSRNRELQKLLKITFKNTSVEKHKLTRNLRKTFFSQENI